MRKSKKPILWIDTETTGLSIKNGAELIAVGLIAESDGQELGRIKIEMNPYSFHHGDDTWKPEADALAINGYTDEKIRQFQDYYDAYCDFKSWMDSVWGNTADGSTVRPSVAGYNVGFDIPFIRRWLSENDVKYGDILSYRSIDIMSVYRWFQHIDIAPSGSARLIDACRWADIELDPHDALADIIATRELSWHMEAKTSRPLARIAKWINRKLR